MSTMSLCLPRPYEKKYVYFVTLSPCLTRKNMSTLLLCLPPAYYVSRSVSASIASAGAAPR